MSSLSRAAMSDHLQAVMAFDIINFQRFWHAGVPLMKDEEQRRKLEEPMLRHAARYVAVWHYAVERKFLGFFARRASKRAGAQIQKAMVEGQYYPDVMRRAHEMVAEFLAKGLPLIETVKLGSGLIYLAPSLDPKLVARIEEDQAMRKGLAYLADELP